MSIQILGLRQYFCEFEKRLKTKETFFEKGWRAKSVSELFANINNYVNLIPDDERYNIYYTAADCMEERGRKLRSQDIIPIDIDGIDHEKIDEYIKLVLETLDLPYDKVGIVSSGNGLQFIIQTEELIDDDRYFDENRIYYKAIIDKLNDALNLSGLIGVADPSVFSKGRILRLPNTKNVKPDKGEKKATLIQGNIQTVPFDLIRASGVPYIEYSDQMSEEMLKLLPPPDSKGVLEGCDFLNWCKENPEDVSEPQWYAMLSIIGRLDKGRDIAHDYSDGHPQYSERETDRKLDQSIKASGPRTCESISVLWGGCPKCKHYQKCKSPITIQSMEYIKTKDTGFYTVVIDDNGIPKKGKPNYDDLMKFFYHKNPFVTMAESGITYVWNDTHWRDYPVKSIDEFAEMHFDPAPNNAMCSEFRGKLQRNYVKEKPWFDIQNKVNFSNGVLDLETGHLVPHSISQGFRYTLPFAYDPDATCPRFVQFLEEVTLKDESLMSVLIEYMGYSLSGIDASIGQKALILVGEGSNGKSVFLDVLKYLAGKDNYSTLSMGNEISRLENRYQLDGKLFNVSEETPSNSMVDNSVFKALVSGGEVQARKLYCDAYSMKNNAKIIMACNELPVTGDVTHGMFRRLLIVPFRAKFDKATEGYDPLIRDKLYEEASGIYNLALMGLERFRVKKVFTESELIDRNVSDYRKANDNVFVWWEENIEACDDGEVALEDLYMTYKFKEDSMGVRAIAPQKFYMRIRCIVNDDSLYIRRRKTGKLKTYVRGFKSLDETEF